TLVLPLLTAGQANRTLDYARIKVRCLRVKLVKDKDMKKLTTLNSLLVMLVLLGASFSLTAFAQEQKKEQTDSALVETLKVKVGGLFAQWDKPDSPGCALGVIKDGSFIYKRGYGMANLDYSIPFSTRFC
ncbi:MAG: hypothetical protein M3R15_34620, partial [Acidobacteriota bacterium]|nr:hypothetical protein [Acidobacteriota bacterium]